MRRKARLTPAVLALLLAGWFVVPTAPWPVDGGHAAAGRTVELAVEGMTCASCSFAVKAALKKLDGVEDAKVSFREKKAVVTYDPDRVSPEDMLSAIGKTGFRASLPESTEK